jgi:integrase
VPKAEIKYVRIVSKGHEYFYAWRGGPRLRGKPGSPEFVASYYEAVQSIKAASTDRFHSVIARYKSDAFKELAPSTRAKWTLWLDRIGEYFGELRTIHFDRHDKIRPIIIKWRNQWKDQPRTADYALQVLSVVCSYAVDPLGEISRNPCEGIKRLYSSDRSGIIWTDADIAQLKETCTVEIAHAVDLAAHTGLRLGDLLRLSWSHVGDNAITITTGKSNHEREAVIPLYDDLRKVLDRIPRRATTVLTNPQHRPWSIKGFGDSFNRAKSKADMKDRDLHFHDLRGSAATAFYLAGLPERVIAEVMGWEEKSVHKIIRRYVSRTAATEDLIRTLNERGTKAAKPVAKPIEASNENEG